MFNAETGDLYTGPIDEGKKSGKGRLYDKDRDEVYDGEFEANKRSGEGMIY